MKKILIVLLLALSVFSLSAAAVPTFKGNRVAVTVEKGTDAETALEAARAELDEDWFLTFTTGEDILKSVSFNELSSMLPLTNAVLLEKKNDAWAVYSLDTGKGLSFTFSDGRINSITILQK